MIDIQCKLCIDDHLTISNIKSFDKKDHVEFISEYRGFNEVVSTWIDKDQAIQIIQHLKQQFDL